MDVIFGGLMCLLIFVFGYLAGADNKKSQCEKTIKEARIRYMNMLKSEYERGYRDGFMAKVTPNELRKAIGLPPLKEEEIINT